MSDIINYFNLLPFDDFIVFKVPAKLQPPDEWLKVIEKSGAYLIGYNLSRRNMN